MAKIKPIQITQLQLDPINPRYHSPNNPISGERQRLQAILNEQGNKLTNLMADIVEAGVDPSSLPIVIPDSESPGQYITVEGNRRLASLKILSSSDIIEELTATNSTKKRFTLLSKEFSANPIEEMSCVILSTRKEANKWIKLRHTGENEGVGTVRWNARQVDSFNELFGTPSLTRQATDYLLEHDAIDIETAQKVTTTNIKRLLEDPDVRLAFGFIVEKGSLITNLPPEEAVKGLKKAYIDFSIGQKNVNDIRHKTDRKSYLQEFSTEDLPKTTNITTKKTSLAKKTKPKTTEPRPPRKSKPTSKERETLIPNNVHLNIDPTKINDIYHELKSMSINVYPNGVGVLFRVFIETSLDYYIKKESLTIHANSSLINKLGLVETYFKNNNIMTHDELKAVRVAISNQNDICSINTFNAYVHNAGFIASPGELKIVWDRLQLFIQNIWA